MPLPGATTDESDRSSWFASSFSDFFEDQHEDDDENNF